ncbi:EF-hand domain-containing protein [Streptomyces omiyaensis]|uniref:EF-hand domain-containing protein n=1 Tax=Streptomyces omiyaensis TaxID=68247 RepID=A0ABW7BUG0_9ACTN|nr:EF-hand domain-containing protein [Streptomyces omiyaensis]GGY51443.1 calcium sensor EFh [Streptomyces omiyaensis]
MASEFQRDKLVNMFRAFDADRNGHLDRTDFEALAERWRRLPRVRTGAGLAARVDAVMLGWWDRLAAHVDTDGDGRIDLDELLAMVDLLPTLREEVAATAETVFDAVDENGDGRISPAEHQRLVDTWHGESVDVTGVFGLLDQDGDGHLSRPEFTALWIQFWTSDDPAEPGNQLCGPVPART